MLSSESGDETAGCEQGDEAKSYAGGQWGSELNSNRASKRSTRFSTRSSRVFAPATNVWSAEISARVAAIMSIAASILVASVSILSFTCSSLVSSLRTRSGVRSATLCKLSSLITCLSCRSRHRIERDLQCWFDPRCAQDSLCGQAHAGRRRPAARPCAR